MTKPPLRPCPFCGSHDLSTTVTCGEPHIHPRAIECLDCGIEGPPATGETAVESEQRCRELWNGALLDAGI